MAPQVGLEPTTLRLTAGCSAIELLRSVGAAEQLWVFYIIGGCERLASSCYLSCRTSSPHILPPSRNLHIQSACRQQTRHQEAWRHIRAQTRRRTLLATQSTRPPPTGFWSPLPASSG